MQGFLLLSVDEMRLTNIIKVLVETIGWVSVLTFIRSSMVCRLCQNVLMIMGVVIISIMVYFYTVTI